MEKKIIYVEGASSRVDEIKSLLEKNNLPTEDITEKIHFISACQNNKIIGCIGIEQYEGDGLLRSFAVDTMYRSRGIGNVLLEKLFALCQQKGLSQLHLLTTTADRYFLKKDFQIVDRKLAPESIQSTTEFSSLCPASSVYMTRRFSVF